MIEERPETLRADAGDSDFPQSDQTELVERIAASPQFRRATRLRELLLFVARHTIRHGSVHIHEHEIGSAVFERPANYDTSIDNIVRVNATELRKRLEQYFSEDGANEAVIVEMPRGSYNVRFRPRPPSPEVPVPLVPADPSVELRPPKETAPAPTARSRSWTTILWPAVSAILVLACGVLLWQTQRLRREVSPWRNGKALGSFWSEFLGNGQKVDIVLADTSFALAEDMEGRSIPLAPYLNYDYKHLDDFAGLSLDRREDLQYALDRNNGSVGDFIVAQRILALDHSTPALHLNFAREYSTEAIKANSVVLIGSRQSNPWVELFEARMNFSMIYDPMLHRSSVHNRQPRTGEKADYFGSGSDVSQSQGLSVVAFMPGLSQSSRALIIEGTDSQATRAAGEFVTSNDALTALLARINTKTFPYFEILIENSQVTGTPLRSQIVAFRVYPRTGNSTTESDRPSSLD